MKKKRQVIALLCIGILSIGITACGNSSAEEEKDIETEQKDKQDVQQEAQQNIQGETNTAKESEKEDSFLNGITLRGEEDIKYTFSNVSVHDPSVIKVGEEYYIFGSHLAGAKSSDLMNWTLIDSDVKIDNKIIPDAKTEMKKAFEWAQTDTFWAPDVIQLEDGNYYMYYCNCKGDSPLSCLGMAVSDKVEGPYKDLGIILKSGMDSSMPSEDGDTYNAAIQPNVVDPCVFYDADRRLWMMYGSYSGGIFILELDTKTGKPLESGYGKKILGENHLRIEAPYVLYSPKTEYYYLFLSFGGLASDGGYNIRVCRSKMPDGPYYDSEGQDMIDCKGPAGTVFNDIEAAKYGVKLMGNFSFSWIEGENGKLRNGYVSPGHNSAVYEEEEGQYFLIFHTRFENRGETHEVRVHQMYLNEEDWFVVSPYRYTGETIEDYTEEEIIGPYKMINHMKDISSYMKKSVEIVLEKDHTISGTKTGTWELKDKNKAIITIDGTSYSGVFVKQWDENGLKNVMTFTVLSKEGVSIWGSGYTALES